MNRFGSIAAGVAMSAALLVAVACFSMYQGRKSAHYGQPLQPSAAVPTAVPSSTVPTASDHDVYIVKEGEDLVSVAITVGVSPSILLELNNLKIGDAIHPGDRLKLPINNSLHKEQL